MNPETMAFIFGGLLILIGILGGGFEVKELKVPQVGGLPRVLAAITGIVFIMLGLGLKENQSTNPAPQAIAPAPAQPVANTIPSAPPSAAPLTTAPAPPPAAAAPAPVAPAPSPEVKTINLNGRWESNMGSYFFIQQQGARITVQEINSVYNATTATAEGTLNGKDIQLYYVNNLGTSGTSHLRVSEDGKSISGTYNDYTTGATGPINMFRY